MADKKTIAVALALGAHNPDVSRALHPSLQTFEMRLTHNKSRIPPWR